MGIDIYTDGSCSGNPGPGGWAAIILNDGNVVKELSESTGFTTNNKAELIAAIEALRYIKSDVKNIRIYTDSMYVRDGMQKWIKKWKRNGWRTSNGKHVSNKELWEELDRQTSRHNKITWIWVKAHHKNPHNNRVDLLARSKWDRSVNI